MPVPLLIVSMLFHAPVFIPGAVPAGIYGNGAVDFFFGHPYYILAHTHHVHLTDTYNDTPPFHAANVHYGTSLSNVDWLHGGAESLLTLTCLLYTSRSAKKALID